MTSSVLSGNIETGAATAVPQAFDVQVIRTWEEIATLQSEWNVLLQDSQADSIFLTWEWVRAWADIVGSSVRPVVVAVRDERGVLVGIAPLYRATFHLMSALPYRVLRVMGDHPTGADYPDWIVRRGSEEPVTDAIVDALVSMGGWDCIWMPAMAGWTGAFERLVAASGRRGLFCQTRARDFSFFELPSEKDAYFKALSKNKRQQLRSETKRLDRPEVSIHRCDADEHVPEFLEALFDLHHRRWQERGDAGTFKRKPPEQMFYRHFTPIALRNGWLRFFALRDAGEVKAIQIGYVYRGVYHQLQEGFDPAYVKGAGNVLRAKVIEGCIEEGVSTYDFLGEMSEHKRRWLGQARVGHDLFIGRTTAKNTLLFTGGVWPTGRYLRPVVARG